MFSSENIRFELQSASNYTPKKPASGLGYSVVRLLSTSFTNSKNRPTSKKEVFAVIAVNNCVQPFTTLLYAQSTGRWPTASNDFTRIRTVPSEFLDPGSQPIQLRFCQLNAKKMAKADLADTLAAIEQLNQIMASMSDEDRAVALDRQEARRVESPQDTAAPNTFADYDNTTLIALAHVERRADDGSEWIELTTTEIDDLLCAEWLAGEIYDVSKPKSDEAREKNS